MTDFQKQSVVEKAAGGMLPAAIAINLDVPLPSVLDCLAKANIDAVKAQSISRPEGMKVLILGATGFVGRNLHQMLVDRDILHVCPTRHTTDAMDLKSLVDVFAVHQPSVVINLAAFVGGIGLNRARPADMIYRNVMMSANVVEACRIAECKLIYLGTVCSYPHTPKVIPFREEGLWDGRPEPTNEPYGVAKKTIGLMLQAYRSQHGLRSAYLLPTNMYGPHDDFTTAGSHVIPAMIARFVRAKAENARVVVNWGDGSASRDFLFVDDCCEAMLRAATMVDDPDPINVGSGVEVTMKDLAAMIAEVIGYDGQIEWDASKPNGQPRRCLDVSRCRDRLGFTPSTPFAEGLRRTVEWYLNVTG